MTDDPNSTKVITDLIGTIPVTEHRRDPLKGLLLAANLALFAVAGLWALWTHRDWLRIIDVAVAILALAEFTRLLIARNF
jgi:hypothetical protein